MKTFSELTPEQQKAAVEKCTNNLLKEITEGTVRFDDKRNKNKLQKKIDAAWKKAEAMQTPWFAHEYIMDAIGDDIRGMATATAQDALYSEPDEHVIDGILT